MTTNELKHFNAKIVISSLDFNRTFDLFIRTKEFYKRELGAEKLAGTIIEQNKNRDGQYYAYVYLDTEAEKEVEE